MAYIILNGKKSTMINGLVISTLPPITKPAKRTIIDEIDGRDGSIVQEVGYSAYIKEFEIGLVDNWDIDEIIEYFNSKGTVTFSNEPDKYYNYNITDQIDFEKLGIFRTATIKMLVQPFKYSLLEGVLPLDPQPNLIELTGASEIHKDGLNIYSFEDTGVVSIKGTFEGDYKKLTMSWEVSAEAIDKSMYKFFLQQKKNLYNTEGLVCLTKNEDDTSFFGNEKIALNSDKETLALNKKKNTYHCIKLECSLRRGQKVDLSFYPKLCNVEIANLKVRNNGNVEARPILSIHGKDQIKVYLNDIKIFEIDIGNEQKIVIDTIKMNAYKDGVLKNRLVKGDYDDLILKPGMNVIKIVGTVDLVKIEKYSRWL